MAGPVDAPDVYHLIFDQTPRVIRWVLTVLTFGLFALAGWLWRRQERTAQRIEDQLHARIDREMVTVHRRLDEMNGHLFEIAKNTRHKE